MDFWYWNFNDWGMDAVILTYFVASFGSEYTTDFEPQRPFIASSMQHGSVTELATGADMFDSNERFYSWRHID